MNIENILQNLKEFSKIPSVVGYEEEFLTYLQKRLKEVDVVSKLENGLLVVETNNKKYSDHFTCLHVDREGLVVKNGKLLYATQFLSKKFNDISLDTIGKRFIGKRFKLSNKHIYIANYTINNNLDLEFILKEKINLSKYENFKVSLSDKILFKENYVLGQMDNVISVAIIFNLLKEKKVKGNVVFSTREEIGKSWKIIMNYFQKNNIEKTDNLLVLDTSPFNKKDDIKNQIILRKRDIFSVFDIKKSAFLENLCKKENIPFLYKDSFIRKTYKSDNFGKTELGHIMKNSGKKFSGTTLQIPNTSIKYLDIIYYKSIINYTKIIEKYYNTLL